MKRNLVLVLLLIFSLSLTSCDNYVDTGGGGGYSSGGGGGISYDDWDSGYDDSDDDWYDDSDDDWYDDSDDDWYDDSDDDWGSDDDDWGWDDDDDDCWDCGDDWGWFDDAQKKEASHSTDIMGDVADKKTAKLNKAGKFFSNKFNLSDTQGLKLAKTINDFEALEKREAKDLEEFSKRLYGLNTEEIVSAIGAAQAGDHSKMDLALEKAAKNFDTTSENMKVIINELHGKALKENGFEF